MASIATGRFGAATLGGELLVVRDGVVGSFGTLQQWLNRKTVSAKMVADTRPIIAHTWPIGEMSGFERSSQDS